MARNIKDALELMIELEKMKISSTSNAYKSIIPGHIKVDQALMMPSDIS